MDISKLVYMEILGVNENKAKDIALQAWNIKNRGTYLSLEFVPDTDTLIVRFEDNSTNIRKVVESWGIVDFEEETERLTMKTSDLKQETLEELDVVYQRTDNPGALVIDIDE